VDGFDGPPEIDYLEAACEKSVGLVGQMIGYSVGGCGVGLVDVDSLNWATKGLRDWDCDGLIGISVLRLGDSDRSAP
jgi:hypothetical protein